MSWQSGKLPAENLKALYVRESRSMTLPNSHRTLRGGNLVDAARIRTPSIDRP